MEPSGTERRSVMDESAAVFSGSPLNAECGALVVDAECWRTVQLGATNVECRCCRVAPSDKERRSVMTRVPQCLVVRG